VTHETRARRPAAANSAPDPRIASERLKTKLLGLALVTADVRLQNCWAWQSSLQMSVCSAWARLPRLQTADVERIAGAKSQSPRIGLGRTTCPLIETLVCTVKQSYLLQRQGGAGMGRRLHRQAGCTNGHRICHFGHFEACYLHSTITSSGRLVGNCGRCSHPVPLNRVVYVAY
jgi:hypothetical protein